MNEMREEEATKHNDDSNKIKKEKKRKERRGPNRKGENDANLTINDSFLFDCQVPKRHLSDWSLHPSSFVFVVTPEDGGFFCLFVFLGFFFWLWIRRHEFVRFLSFFLSSSHRFPHFSKLVKGLFSFYRILPILLRLPGFLAF